MSAAMHSSTGIGSAPGVPLNLGGTGDPAGGHEDDFREDCALCVEQMPFDELEIQLVILSNQLERLEAVVTLLETDLEGWAATQGDPGAGAPRAGTDETVRDESNGRSGTMPGPVPQQRRAGPGGPSGRGRRSSREKRATRRRRR